MNRHRVSTLIGALGLPEHEKQLAYEHFGHSGSINQNIYQAPPAEQQLATTGKYLRMIDKGHSTVTKQESTKLQTSTHDEQGSKKLVTATAMEESAKQTTYTRDEKSHEATFTAKKQMVKAGKRKRKDEEKKYTFRNRKKGTYRYACSY